VVVVVVVVVVGWFRGASAWTAICAYRQSHRGPKVSYVKSKRTVSSPIVS